MPALFVTGLLLLLFGVGQTQTFHPHFYHYSKDDGLPSSEVHVAFQDRAGYMWFGTDNGIARFDGYEFEIFDSRQGLEDVVVFGILEDREGTVWVSTYSGRVYYFADGHFHPYRYNDKLVKFKKKNHVLALIEIDKQDDFIFTVVDVGEMKVTADGEFTFVNEELRGEKAGKVTIRVDHPYFDSLAYRLVYYAKKRTQVFDTITLYDAAFMLGSERLEYGNIPTYGSLSKAFYYQPANRLYLLGWKEIIRLEGDKITGRFSADLMSVTRVEHYLESGRLVGNYGGRGIYYLDLASKGNPIIDTVLLGHSISNFEYDRQGGLWITSTDDGVFYTAYPDIVNYSGSKGLPNVKPLSVAVVDEHSFFAGYSDGAVYYHNQQTHATTLITPDQGSSYTGVFSLYYDRERQILYTNNFKFYFDPASADYLRREMHQPVATKDIPPIRDFNRPSGTLADELLMTANAALGIYDLRDNTIKYVYDSRDEIAQYQNFHSFHQDMQGRYWLATLAGLYRFDPQRKAIEQHNLQDPVFDNRIVQIVNLPNGAMLMGSRGAGLIYYDRDTTFTITTKDGLASDMVRYLHASDDASVWVATLTGISKVSFAEHGHAYTLRSFYKVHGLPSEEVYFIDSYKNDLWLATSAGIVQFVEPVVEERSHPPHIFQVSVNGELRDARESLLLEPSENNFSLSFRTLNYRMLGSIQYRYRIRPEEEWIYTSNGTIQYARLSPGRYRFEVQSQNADQIWSASTTLPILLATPWYSRWSTRIFGLLLVLALMAAGFYGRDRRRRKELAFAKQIDELERSALQAQMNPHFIFNSLNSIQHFILQNDRQKAVYYLPLFAQLIRDTLRVSRAGRHTLGEEVVMLTNYLELEQMRFKEFSYTITVAPHLSADRIMLPSLLIQPFVENAIKHGLKGKQTGGKVTVDFAGTATELLVTISDNGTGFDPQQARDSRSFGMDITQRRLEMMQHNKRLSPMQLEPLYDNDGQMAGMRVLIKIKAEIVDNTS